MMRNLFTAVAFAIVFSVSLSAAAAMAKSSARSGGGPDFGVAEDASKYADDAGNGVYADLHQLGMTQNRWTLTYSGDPTAIDESAFLDRAAPAAKAAGIDITLSVYPAVSSTPNPASFCQWVSSVARRYPTITRVIIGNEVNATRFWSPQHTSSDPNAGPRSYEAVLAQCYDALKAVNPAITVIGMGLAPRAVTSNSTAPLAFIRAVGTIYRASGRTTPIMDQLAVHPYPNPNQKPPPAPDKAMYLDPDFYGIPQLDRVKQAVYDAFKGTNQPTTLNGLKIVVDEIGYQSIGTTGSHGYTGEENSPSVSESDQAAYYARVVQLYACDPAIEAVLFFHLIDESNLNTSPTSGGWQSGLAYPDGSPKPSFARVQQAIARGCTGAQVSWSPQGVTTTTKKTTKPKAKTTKSKAKTTTTKSKGKGTTTGKAGESSGKAGNSSGKAGESSGKAGESSGKAGNSSGKAGESSGKKK